MPAVKWFALYAAVSLTLNFIMQITCFVAAMAIDEQRKIKPTKKGVNTGSSNGPNLSHEYHSDEGNKLYIN